MAVEIESVVLNGTSNHIVRGGGPVEVIISGNGLKLDNLKAGFIDAQGHVVEELNAQKELQLTIDQPDSDYISDNRFPIVVEAFKQLPAGDYRIFVRTGTENIDDCNYGGLKPLNKEAVTDKYSKTPLGTCYLFTELIKIA